MLTSDQLSGPCGYTIYVNSTDALYRRRFTIAHEIAHYLLHRNTETKEFRDDRMYRSPGITDAKEAEANRLAADILMPRRIIRRLLDQGVTDPNLMAAQLKVSPDAMEVRLGLRSKFNPRPKRNYF
jgi:Zn-dependent peptidase ImmA (M78 family)